MSLVSSHARFPSKSCRDMIEDENVGERCNSGLRFFVLVHATGSCLCEIPSAIKRSWWCFKIDYRPLTPKQVCCTHSIRMVTSKNSTFPFLIMVEVRRYVRYLEEGLAPPFKKQLNQERIPSRGSVVQRRLPAGKRGRLEGAVAIQNTYDLRFGEIQLVIAGVFPAVLQQRKGRACGLL